MNGEDLKFLAQRASTIEGGPANRLAEVHERIGVARRRRVMVAVAGTAGLIAAVVLAVQVGTGGTNPESLDPAKRHDASAAPGPEIIAAGPARGTCWMAPEEEILAAEGADLFVDVAPVPCSEPHNLETVQVVPLSEATAEQVSADGDVCWEYVRTYLGVDGEHWVHWGWKGYLPTEEQIDAGASWLRCDAVFPGTWDFSEVRTTSVSAHDAAVSQPIDLWSCLDEPPTVTAQPLVPCDRPHRYEQTGTLAVINDAQTYPSSAQLRAEESTCLASLTQQERADGVTVTVWWDGPEAFEPGVVVAGSCFKFRQDGAPLPPRG